MKEAKARIKTFLSQYFGNHELQEDEDIFSLGFINSMFAMQLVLFIEQEFQIVIDNEDLDFENFRTINAMVSLIERKTAVLAGD
ncbi:putative D-alanyl carrier protein [Tolypothrix sp. NIES-4075]|uniref:acyl carrier protein n=1 Tax=Tolypothrix sp. NIES-4075 TaxID=2005459 RepID=UPI000B5C430E|nr:acyl carrier protein [Tolypothrix sp. NIES-4075]GAX42275.1 putative D-alanyl carrier protein [Tolypothrix sp. NIES-4075]